MNYLIVKPAHEPRKKMPLQLAVTNDGDFFTKPDLTASIDYTPHHKLETNEWFRIKKFKGKGYKNDFLELKYDASTFNTLESKYFSKAKYICTENIDKCRVFQKLMSSSFVFKKLLDLNSSSYITDGNFIVINEIPDAIYDTRTDVFYFRDLSRISSIFEGIDSLYREATNDEVDSFLKDDLINNQEAFKVGIPNRKKIALALNKLNDFSKRDRVHITSYIKTYYPNLKVNNGKFVISSDIELTHFIYGIEQRFYTTEIGNEKRIASAVFALS